MAPFSYLLSSFVSKYRFLLLSTADFNIVYLCDYRASVDR